MNNIDHSSIVIVFEMKIKIKGLLFELSTKNCNNVFVLRGLFMNKVKCLDNIVLIFYI